MANSFNARTTLNIGAQRRTIYALDRAGDAGRIARLPYSLKVLLENLLRNEDGENVTADDIRALVDWRGDATPDTEIAFTPARVILQDFTGVPAVVDLAAMRDAVGVLGGDAARVNPLAPAELVIDHSVQVDVYGSADARSRNSKIEFERNRERYAFLRWGQQAFDNFKVVPPDTGIVHQVNIEHLARVVFDDDGLAYPDTLVGTDSHTTMVNGLGVLGWGVGGIEAEAAMLGQPVTMLIPKVVGFRLVGRLPEGATATDLVLTVTEILRGHGVVGKFVEFFGDGLSQLPLADRATIANMSPEFGATCAIFPVDNETLRYLALTGRDADAIQRVEDYARRQGMFREDGDAEADYSEVIELDLASVEPSLAGPRRPQDRIALSEARETVTAALRDLAAERDERRVPNEEAARFAGEGGATAVAAEANRPAGRVTVGSGEDAYDLADGAVVIAAITSCTNTSNPAVMVAAALVAKNAAARGVGVKPWVKTSLAPGSRVVTEYLQRAGLVDDLEALGFYLVGYGCTTCIGNSGPLSAPVSKAIHDGDLSVCSILSGNRNFEGRIHPEVRMNFLASPPLVVAYAIAGRMDIDLASEPLASDADGRPVYLKDLWPAQQDIAETIAACVDADMFAKSYADIYRGDERWQAMPVPDSERYQWDEASTYIRNPPYFAGMTADPPGLSGIRGARVLCLLGDSVTTDHISPAGAIMADSPAGQYLAGHGVERKDFNSYGSRRGNHEVMMRGTFANIRLRNRLAPGTEGGHTRHLPSGEAMTIFDAAMRYAEEEVPLLVLAGNEYGSGSSRDWAAKGPMLLGVRAVIAASYERIHRSNLVGMGILPLQFPNGQDAASLGLTGAETYHVGEFASGDREVEVTAVADDGNETRLTATIRIDTPKEWDYYAHGGILHYVVRQLATSRPPTATA